MSIKRSAISQSFLVGMISLTLMFAVSCGDDDSTNPDQTSVICDRFTGDQLSTRVWASPSSPMRSGAWHSSEEIITGESVNGQLAVLPLADSLQPNGDYVFIVDMVVEPFRQERNGGQLLLIHDTTDYYAIAIQPESGEYRATLTQMDEDTLILTPDTTQCIQAYPEDTNRVRLVRSGTRFTIHVNGHRIASFDDTEYDGNLGLALGATGAATFSSACLYMGVAPDPDPVSCDPLADICDAFSGNDLKTWFWSFGTGRSGTWFVEDEDIIGNWPADADNANNAVLPLAESVQPSGDFVLIADQVVELFDLDRNGGSIKLWHSYQNFYRVSVDPESQQFWIDAFVDSTRSEIVTRTTSPDIFTQVGRINEIRLERSGDQYSLYINSDKVADFEDVYFSGDVDVSLGAIGQARFDRVCLFTEYIPDL